MTGIDLSEAQIAALRSMRVVLAPDQWVLIGASAIRCHIPLPRPTADVDFVVAADATEVFPRLQAAGWLRHPKKLQTWTHEGATIDEQPQPG